MQHSAMIHNHNSFLVALSIVIAILASYVALDLAGQVTAARGRPRYSWLLGGAVAMGIGIWSMHFTAMLAFQLPVPVTYDVPTVLVSLLAAIIAAGLALFIVSRDTMTLFPVLGGGVFMGAAIAAMHYIGMDAMRLQASLQYDPVFFTLSIVIAISASLAALWLAFHFRQETTRTANLLKIGSAVVMGIAIAGMHYTAMQAAIFIPSESFRADSSQAIDISTLGVMAVTIGTFIVLGGALGISLIDKRLATQTEYLAENEQRYRATLEAVNAELQARVSGLQLVTEVSQTMTAILNRQRLVSEVVEQIRSAFDYYHVHIYLFDEPRENLVLVGGSGEAGRAMLEKGHKIPYHKGMVGRAATTGTIILAADVSQQPDWLPNPLLSETKSEVAVPITLSEKVLGVLDVQHNIPNGLKPVDIDLIQIIANQMAVALHNADLFADFQTALEDARLAREQYIQQAWEKTIVYQQGGQHLATQPGTPHLPEKVLAEAKRYALAHERPAVVAISDHRREKTLQDNPSADNDRQALRSIVAPVTLGNKTIGIFQAHRVGDSAEAGLADPSWTEKDLALVEAVLDQVTQIAENRRLFEETLERVGREQTIREITDKLRAAPTLDLLLETAARELGQHLGVRHTVLELGIEAEIASKSNGAVNQKFGKQIVD
ncbi:MAG: GAF domain-containing protein [Chloroflexi bacterium]|nr:GAF domain-containing protein [Chloroflexota bacterium]